MATATEIEAIPGIAPPAEAVEPVPEFYSRASLRGDFMVMIAGQTVEDWKRLAPPNQICEYIDGIIYMPNTPTDEHQYVAGFLFHLLDGFRCERGTGEVRFAPCALVLRDDRFPQPDVFVRPIEGVEGVPALLTVEILSPSTRAQDLTKKLAIYQENAIPELWSIDMEGHMLRVDRRGADGGYDTHRVEAGVWYLASLPGFWIDVAWLWDRPLPNPRRCLEAILAGPPG